MQGTVVTYLRDGGICSNQIKQGLLLSLTVERFLKSVNIWHSYGEKVDCVMDFLRLLPVWWPTIFLVVTLTNIQRFLKLLLTDSAINLS